VREELNEREEDIRGEGRDRGGWDL